jgi:hypothetical protein
LIENGEGERAHRLLERIRDGGDDKARATAQKIISSLEAGNAGPSIAKARDKYPSALNPKKLEAEYQALMAQDNPKLSDFRKLERESRAGVRVLEWNGINQNLAGSLDDFNSKVQSEIGIRESARDIRKGEYTPWVQTEGGFGQVQRSQKSRIGALESTYSGVYATYITPRDNWTSPLRERLARESDPAMKAAITSEMALSAPVRSRYSFSDGYLESPDGRREPSTNNGLFQGQNRISASDLPADVRSFFESEGIRIDSLRGDAVPRYAPTDLDTLTPGETQSILNALDTDAEVAAFLDSLPPELAATLLQAESSEDDLAESLVLFVGQGVLALALWTGLRYQTMRVSVPEGWQELGEIERIGRAQRAIASAERRTITDEELGQQRDAIDAIYRLRAQKHADDLLGERITLEQFHQRMIDEIKQSHTVQRKLGQGRLGPQDKVSLRRDIDEQLGHLQKFIDQIRGGTQTPKQIRDRAGRYGGNGGYSFNQARGAVAEAMGGLYAERELGNCSPHCWDCVEYASRPRLPLSEVPRPRQACRCSQSCCCQVRVYASLSDSLPIMTIS